MIEKLAFLGANFKHLHYDLTIFITLSPDFENICSIYVENMAKEGKKEEYSKVATTS